MYPKVEKITKHTLSIIIALLMCAVVSSTWAETPEEWRERGIKALEGGYYNIALACFTKAIALNPNDADSYHTMGVIYNKQGETKKAISYLEKAIVLDPTSAKSHYYLGTVYTEKRKFGKAIRAFKNATALNPQDSDVHYSLGEALFEKKKTKEAISEYEKVLSLNPSHADAHHGLGTIYLKKGAPQKAAEHFYKAGLLFLKQGNKEGALKAYEGLKKTNAKELEESLYEKLYPEKR
jgi:tetratricopeptide (TPR) repeat protein